MEHRVIGKIIGNRYRILREVGSGGMAWVYLAEDINEGRLVAAKILYPQFSEDLSYIQRFNREAKLASSMADQHIVRMLDYGATRDVYYLVMEYIEGQDLRCFIDDHGSLPWPDALRILDQLAIALEHAHLHGVVHRDIKPQNLMITKDGVLKVLDFGIARARMLPSLTQSGFVGSPYYISPEQAMGEEVDIRSDIYSAGIVLYEMLSGQVPYDATSPWSIISQHIASGPPRLYLKEGHLPESAETLLHRMIAKRSKDRFQTPTALREAIAWVLEGRPLPQALDTQPPAIPDQVATAEGLYQRAQQAADQDDWQLAVDLLNQVVKLNPEHPEAPAKLAHAGRQARLAALYAAACRAMEGGRWQEVVDELSEVISAEPQYRDAAELLERARAARQGIDVAQAVSDLYDQGVAHIKAREWKGALSCLNKVQQLAPGYKQTQSLLLEAKRHLRSRPRWLPGLGAALRRVRLALILAVALLVVIAGAYFLSLRDDDFVVAGLAAETDDPSVQAYREAQEAFQGGDWDKAIDLLDVVLTRDPGFQDARALLEQAEAYRALDQSFREGEAAYLAERWDEAIDLLDRLRQTNVAFRIDQVQDMLCDAYLQRGQAQARGREGISNTDSIQAALNDYETGLAICPDSQALSARQGYATSFLLALESQSLEDLDMLIQELAPILTAGPEYANDDIRHMLYVALVKRGDIRQQVGELTEALSDYEQALALDEIDSLDATSRRAEVRGELGVSAPSETPQPTELPSQAAPKYVMPTLISPSDESSFRGRFTTVLLEWESVGMLASDEYYDVTVMHYVGQEVRYWGGAVSDTWWQVPVEAGVGEAANDRFYWWVTVRQANSAAGPGQLDRALSPSSNTRTFYWSE
jgi:tetratricopeptide (TPR) repeat protein